MVEPQTERVPRRRPGSSAWHWLLVVPVVVPLLVFLFNSKDPYVLGFPRYYWLQLLFILLSVATTLVVYNMTKSREG
jgi:ABC-type transport system involved in cytochrome c biogenesis permease component